jgi:anti-repressor protein
MNDLQIFKNEEFGEVRSIAIDGKPYFVGKDIAEILGYSNTRDALISHVDEEDKADVVIHDGCQNRNMKAINESGLYSLILGSKLPNAKKFKKWVTGDVLLDNPDLLIAAATKLKEERAARLEAEKKVKILEPKGEFYDDIVGSKDSIEMGHVAKVLGIRGIGRNNLFALLRDKKVLDRNNIPYQQYVDCGYFRVLEQKYTVPSGETKINIKTMVFQKGVDFIRKKIKEL